jgi:hypothetical protein
MQFSLNDLDINSFWDEATKVQFHCFDTYMAHGDREDFLEFLESLLPVSDDFAEVIVSAINQKWDVFIAGKALLDGDTSQCIIRQDGSNYAEVNGDWHLVSDNFVKVLLYWSQADFQFMEVMDNYTVIVTVPEHTR